jgi:anti-sigma factor RsiW
MIRKSEYFEQTDKYLNSEMTQPELKGFEIQLGIDSDLAEEYNLQMDVEQAICEQDIISLRSNLNQIVQNQTDQAYNEISVFDSFSFGLSEEFSSHKNLNNLLNSEDIFNFGHTFPQIHLYQHKVAGKENIHQFYKEKFDNELVTDEGSFTAFEEGLFSDVQIAMEENDIFDLRANLTQISQTMPAHQYSADDLEDYVYDRMDAGLRAQFEEELATNTNLAQDLMLVREIDLAVAENDIMNLRASLNEIQKNEFHSPASIEELESYINSELSDEELASFEAELTSNQKLKGEIDLIKNIDLALMENDVMQLRSKLQGIAQQIASEKRTERSFSGKFKSGRAIVISSIAASIILLLGITGLLSRHSSQGEIYQKFYTKYESAGIVRSANLTADQTLTVALEKFDNRDYQEALNLFSEVIAKDQNSMVGHFYSGVSLQETGKYQNAIKEYETVIVDKDNLFMEQANWYIGLCYLQTNENKKAYRQFKKIAENKGFYQQKALSILGKMKDPE